MNFEPKIGHSVIYRTDGRNGLVYDLHAVVNCTRDSHPGDYPDGQHNPLPVPDTRLHVHLTVSTPGGQGTQVVWSCHECNDAQRYDCPSCHGNAPFVRAPADDTDFVGASRIVPGSGTYVELNVGLADDHRAPAPRTWRW